MWLTPVGERTLEGAERALFVSAISQMYEVLRFEETDPVWSPEGYPWADTSCRSKIVALAKVAQAVLSLERSAPELHAWSESSLYAVVDYIKQQLDRKNKWYPERVTLNWQNLVQQAMKNDGFGVPHPEHDGEIWAAAFEQWAQARWLATNAWKLMEAVMDLPPANSTRIKNVLGISADYFSEPFPLTTNGSYLGAIEFFERLSVEFDLIQRAYA